MFTELLPTGIKLALEQPTIEEQTVSTANQLEQLLLGIYNVSLTFY